jgi:hypothetical protein
MRPAKGRVGSAPKPASTSTTEGAPVTTVIVASISRRVHAPLTGPSTLPISALVVPAPNVAAGSRGCIGAGA